MPLLFVYGTLKRGYGNNVLLKDARFVSEAVTFDSSYVMWGRGFPLVIEGQNDGHPVKGELFYIDEEQLASCDRLEGHPDWYCRQTRFFKRVDKDGKDKGVVSAWIYLQPKMPVSANIRRAPVMFSGAAVLEWRHD